MIRIAREFLLSSQNHDGGWGAEKGKESQTEVTSLCLLGLTSVRDKSLSDNINRALNWLTNQQSPDGSWPLFAHLKIKKGSWTSALATLALVPFEAHRQRALRGAEWLLRQEGSDLGWLGSLVFRLAPQELGLNPDLKGWPWTVDTFSWVEPTAYALIALKKLRPDLAGSPLAERIRQGELMLYDRMCAGGGWNYGNPKVFGRDLKPYPDITALALIALQDHQTHEANQLSLDALRTMLLQFQSGLTLSWSILCFSLYGHTTSKWREILSATYHKRGFLGQAKAFALALLASGQGPDLLRL